MASFALFYITKQSLHSQVCFFSATLHSPAVRDMTSKICVNPTWVDLKGPDSVPETVHHVLFRVDLNRDEQLLAMASTKAITDGIHKPNASGNDLMSLQIKEMKMQV